MLLSHNATQRTRICGQLMSTTIFIQIFDISDA